MKSEHLVSSKLLARNTAWNFLGQLAPLLIAVLTIPRLIQGLGTDRFGVLTIGWIVVGSFSLFDFGLGRALTNVVAQKLGQGKSGEEALPPIVWTANLLMFLLGLLGMGTFALLSPFLARLLLKGNPELQSETAQSFYILSLSIPLVVSSAGFRGILEAQQKFRVVNLVRAPMSIATFLLPLVTLSWSHDLSVIMLTLVGARLGFLIAYITLSGRSMPAIFSNIAIQASCIPDLLRYGGWLTVSNVVTPLMLYLDRFIIGGIISLTAVAYYSTSYEVATKLLLLPTAVAGVLFPAFSTAAVSDQARFAGLFHRAVRMMIVTLFPSSALLIIFAKDGMTLWVGADFAAHSFVVLQWLAAGVFANGIAFVPLCILQATGRPDLVGKLSLFELPVYLWTMWYLSVHFGVAGTAVAWTLRVFVDCVLLMLLAMRSTSGNQHVLFWIIALTGVLFGLVLMTPLLTHLLWRVALTVLLLCAGIYAIRHHLVARGNIIGDSVTQFARVADYVAPE